MLPSEEICRPLEPTARAAAARDHAAATTSGTTEPLGGAWARNVCPHPYIIKNNEIELPLSAVLGSVGEVQKIGAQRRQGSAYRVSTANRA